MWPITIFLAYKKVLCRKIIFGNQRKPIIFLVQKFEIYHWSWWWGIKLWCHDNDATLIKQKFMHAISFNKNCTFIFSYFSSASSRLFQKPTNILLKLQNSANKIMKLSISINNFYLIKICKLPKHKLQ